MGDRLGIPRALSILLFQVLNVTFFQFEGKNCMPLPYVGRPTPANTPQWPFIFIKIENLKFYSQFELRFGISVLELALKQVKIVILAWFSKKLRFPVELLGLFKMGF